MIGSVLEAFAKFLKYTGQECKAVSRKLIQIGVVCGVGQEGKNYASESSERSGLLKPLRELQARGRGGTEK